MARSNAVQEQPSMEDILTSIRRIIDDGNQKPVAAAQAQKQVANDPAPAQAKSSLASQPNTKLKPNAFGSRMTSPKTLTPMPSVVLAKPEPRAEKIEIEDVLPKMPVQAEPPKFESNGAVEVKPNMQTPDIKANTPAVDDAELDSFLESLDAKYETLVEENAPEPSYKDIEGEYDRGSLVSTIINNEMPDITAPPQTERRNNRLSDNDRSALNKVRNALSTKVSRENQDQAQNALAASRLVSDQTRNAIGGSLENLSAALATEAGRDLPGMTEEILKPMLSDWLDNNLPSMVERLVRAEIERIARGE